MTAHDHRSDDSAGKNPSGHRCTQLVRIAGPDWKIDSRVARFGPTTPTRARRPFDASVDPTDAVPHRCDSKPVFSGKLRSVGTPSGITMLEGTGTGGLDGGRIRGDPTEQGHPAAAPNPVQPGGHRGANRRSAPRTV